MTESPKSGGELFIVDNSDESWKGLKYLHDWTEIASAFDIATGYFEIGALLALDGKWQKLEKIRILMGDSVSHFSVARIPICHGTFYLGNKGQDYFAPLLVFDDDLLASEKSGRSNFAPLFLSELKKVIGAEAAKLTPEGIFH